MGNSGICLGRFAYTRHSRVEGEKCCDLLWQKMLGYVSMNDISAEILNMVFVFAMLKGIYIKYFHLFFQERKRNL